MGGTYEKIVQFLRLTPFPAADQALGWALAAERGTRAGILARTLLGRGSDEALAHVARAYHKLDDTVRRELLNRGPGISGVLRSISRDPDPQVRTNVVALVAAGGQPRLAYVLSGLLHDELPGLRTQAAECFRDLAMTLAGNVRPPGGAGTAAAPEMAEELKRFLVTLDATLETFPHHRRTEVVEAGMYLADLLPDSIWARFTGDRSRVGHAAAEILQRDSNVHFAGFAFRALTCPELGKAVVKSVASTCNGEFLRRWLGFGWYRFNAAVRKNLARINRPFRWLEGNIGPVFDLPVELQICFVDILMLTSIAPGEKKDLLAAMLAGAGPLVQEHLVDAFIRADLPDTCRVLSQAVNSESAARFSARAARMAQRYLARMGASTAVSTPPAPAAPAVEPGVEQYFDQFWLAFDRLDSAARRAAVERLGRLDGSFSERVRDKFAAADPEDRARALALVRECGLGEKFREDIHRLCGDIAPVVRSSAVRALADVADPKVEQKLIEALDDEDPRVQANAIEALGGLDPPDLLDRLEPKLSSPNNRIRANAIKAILKPQYTLALRVLARMLDHSDPAFRRSAVWAVMQTLPLHLGGKINHLARHDPDPDVKALARQALGVLVRSWRDLQQQERAADQESIA